MAEQEGLPLQALLRLIGFAALPQIVWDNTSKPLGNFKMRWVAFHLAYVLEGLLGHICHETRLLATWISSLCGQLVDPKERSGDGWEGLFCTAFAGKTIASIHNSDFFQKTGFPMALSSSNTTQTTGGIDTSVISRIGST